MGRKAVHRTEEARREAKRLSNERYRNSELYDYEL